MNSDTFGHSLILKILGIEHILIRELIEIIKFREKDIHIWVIQQNQTNDNNKITYSWNSN